VRISRISRLTHSANQGKFASFRRASEDKNVDPQHCRVEFESAEVRVA